MLEPHLVDDQDLVVLLGNLLPAIRNVAAAMLSIDLPHRKAVLMPGPANVERVVITVEPALDSSGRNMAVTGIHPGQVTVAGSNEDLQMKSKKLCDMLACPYIILLLAVLLPAPGYVAAVVLRVHLPCKIRSSIVKHLYP